MEIRIADITPENFTPCINLKVADGQENFVAPNVRSIAESKIYPFLVPRAIYNGAEMIGFALHGREPETGKVYLARLMIDAAHQGKGFGRAAVKELIEEMCREYECEEIFLSFVPDNVGAAALYQSVGFERTGETDESGEIIMRLKIK